MSIHTLRQLLPRNNPAGARPDTLRMNYEPNTGRQVFTLDATAGPVTVVAEPRSSEAQIAAAILAKLAEGSNPNEGDAA